MKEISAMQQMIDWATNNRFSTEDQAGVKFTALDYDEFLSKATELRDTVEKKNIVEACDVGYRNGHGDFDLHKQFAESYYSTKFNNQK